MTADLFGHVEEQSWKWKYERYEVFSALQKEVRRCNWKMAGWWAFVLLEGGQTYMFWRRMYVIAAEDCEARAIELVDAYKKGFDWVTNGGKTKSGDGILFGVKCAMEVARLKKDRTADDYNCYYQDLASKKNFAALEELPSIPDYALDGHTQAGIRKGRGFKTFAGHLYFWKESAK